MIDDWAISMAGTHFKSDLTLHSLTKLSREQVLAYNENQWTVTFAKDLGPLDLDVAGLVSQSILDEDIPSKLHGLMLSWETQGEHWQARLANRLPECVKITGAVAGQGPSGAEDKAKRSLCDWAGVLTARGYHLIAVTRTFDSDKNRVSLDKIAAVSSDQMKAISGHGLLIGARLPAVAKTIEATLKMARFAHQTELALADRLQALQAFCDRQTEALKALQTSAKTQPSKN